MTRDQLARLRDKGKRHRIVMILRPFEASPPVPPALIVRQGGVAWFKVYVLDL